MTEGERFVVLDNPLGRPTRTMSVHTALSMVGMQSEYQRLLNKIMSEVLIADAFSGRIIRYAWMDQHPKSWSPERLRDAARDSVIRYARHYGLTFKFTHDQWGERWKWDETQREYFPTGVYGWSSEAVITGRAVR